MMEFAFGIAILFAVLLCAVALVVHQCREIKWLKRDVSWWKSQAKSAKRGWNDAVTERDAAIKQIIELRRNSPGRDKSGRFVKKPKSCESHGSE